MKEFFSNRIVKAFLVLFIALIVFCGGFFYGYSEGEQDSLHSFEELLSVKTAQTSKALQLAKELQEEKTRRIQVMTELLNRKDEMSYDAFSALKEALK